jgi:hypothetical protein
VILHAGAAPSGRSSRLRRKIVRPLRLPSQHPGGLVLVAQRSCLAGRGSAIRPSQNNSDPMVVVGIAKDVEPLDPCCIRFSASKTSSFRLSAAFAWEGRPLESGRGSDRKSRTHSCASVSRRRYTARWTIANAPGCQIALATRVSPSIVILLRRKSSLSLSETST